MEKKYQYSIKKDDDGIFVVTFDDPYTSCTQGDTFEEAVEMAEELSLLLHEPEIEIPGAGHILQEHLSGLNYHDFDFAYKLRVSYKELTDIMADKRAFSPEMDEVICKELGLSKGYFLRIQQKCAMMEIKRIRSQAKKQIKHISDKYKTAIVSKYLDDISK